MSHLKSCSYTSMHRKNRKENAMYEHLLNKFSFVNTLSYILGIISKVN